MNNELTPVLHQKSTDLKWVEVVLYLSDTAKLDRKKVRQWADQFSRVTVAAVGERPETLPDNVTWHSFKADCVRSEVWNALLEGAQKEWVLFIEDDEYIRFSSFPDERSINEKKWAPALIKHYKNGITRQIYQTRLVNATTGIFEGRELPDCTRYIRENNIVLSNYPIIIERETNPTQHIDIDEELSIKRYSPKLYLVQGERYFNAKKYVHAAAQYRQVLKEEKLLPFDRLGAVNGLASCLAEQHKWTNAITLAKESLNAELFQSLPYLIQFKIHELRKEWYKAYEIMCKYHEHYSLHSRASFDKIIDEEQTLVDLAHMALRTGNRREAANYFDKFFTFKRGDVDRSLLYKVLVLSIELNDFERSVSLFESLFKKKLSDKLDEKDQEELNDIMTMFMKRKWYEYVSEVYTKLNQSYPENRIYKRKLIVALTKTNRLDKAKTMLANIV